MIIAIKLFLKELLVLLDMKIFLQIYNKVNKKLGYLIYKEGELL